VAERTKGVFFQAIILGSPLYYSKDFSAESYLSSNELYCFKLNLLSLIFATLPLLTRFNPFKFFADLNMVSCDLGRVYCVENPALDLSFYFGFSAIDSNA